MKRVLLICWVMLLPLLTCAQDFVTLFMDEHKNDSNLTCVTISPKMMEEILRSDLPEDEKMQEVIVSLKSMQTLDSKTNGDFYFASALEVAKNNAERFEEYLSYNDVNEDYRILVRKRKKAVIELAMLLRKRNTFAVINCTGSDIKPEFISRLADSMKQKRL